MLRNSARETKPATPASVREYIHDLEAKTLFTPLGSRKANRIKYKLKTNRGTKALDKINRPSQNFERYFLMAEYFSGIADPKAVIIIPRRTIESYRSQIVEPSCNLNEFRIAFVRSKIHQNGVLLIPQKKRPPIVHPTLDDAIFHPRAADAFRLKCSGVNSGIEDLRVFK